MSGPDQEEQGPEPEGRDQPGGVADGSMRASIMSVFFVGLCFAVVGFAIADWRTGLGVAAGGLIATANLWVFARVGQAFVSREGNTAPWAVIALLKMTFLFGGVWLILRTGVFSALSLIAGYAALPIGITVGSLFGPKPGIEENGTRGDRNVIKGARAGRKGPP